MVLLGIMSSLGMQPQILCLHIKSHDPILLQGGITTNGKYFKEVMRLTPTRFWINNVTRRQAELAIAEGAVGATQNPAYLSKVLDSEDDGAYLKEMAFPLIEQYESIDDVIAELQRQAIAGICKRFERLFDQTGGRLGLVSIQANPFAENTTTILDNAEKSLSLARNFIIKIPATKDGLAAIGQLIANKVPVLATEVMSIDQILDILKARDENIRGLKDPAPLWIAHINGIFDEQMSEDVKRAGTDIEKDVLRQASLLLARKFRSVMREYASDAQYMAGGARTLEHFTDWVGVDGAVTINWKGTADKLIERDGPVTDVFNAPSSYLAIDKLIEKLPGFAKAWIPGSMKVEEYEYFSPVVRFRNSFEKGWISARTTIESWRVNL